MNDGSNIKSDRGLTKAEGSSESVYAGSPLAVIGLFMEVVRARFVPPNQSPWRWREDPRSLPEDENTVDAPAHIYIESDLNDDPEARNAAPAIFVGIEDIRYNQIVVGDKYAHHMPTRDMWYLAHLSVPVVLQCVSPKRGESAILGDMVFHHILAGKNPIRETFDLHAIDNLSLGKTQPFRRMAENSDNYTTPVTFMVTLNSRWHVKPYAPVLQGILLRFTANGASFTESAIAVAVKKSSNK